MAILSVPVHAALAEIRDPAVAYAERIGALFHVIDTAGGAPARLGPETLDCLGRLLQEPRLGSRRQDLFLARKGAEALLALTEAPDGGLVDGAWDVLMAALRRTRGLAHRGTAETIGALPCVAVGPSAPVPKGVGDGPSVPFARVMEAAGMNGSCRLRVSGRSVVAGDDRCPDVLVLKMARADDDPVVLAAEAGWMGTLGDAGERWRCRFEVPRPLVFEGRHLVRLAGLPRRAVPPTTLHRERWAIAYLAPPAYFDYPNDTRGAHRPAPENFVEIMARGARLMGALAADGIVHEAPIPLFHNRVQRHRRRDHGRYEWFRGGRLDRWLASCAYPNWGPTGLRDFEHLVGFQGPPLHLYRHMGNHFLSLLLVAGSYFRAREPSLAGVAPDGSPVDARHLFDPELLNRTIDAVYRGYYRGFVGAAPPASLPLDTAALTGRMIDEMGIDRHMEEILRAADQQAMSPQKFRDFLRRRGYTDEAAAALRRGERDLAVHTGPHLGGFNRTISLPELITAVETMAATCIAGRHRRCRTGHSAVRAGGDSRPT